MATTATMAALLTGWWRRASNCLWASALPVKVSHSGEKEKSSSAGAVADHCVPPDDGAAAALPPSVGAAAPSAA